MNSFEDFISRIEELSEFENVDFFIVGYSMLGQPIYGILIGLYDGK